MINIYCDESCHLERDNIDVMVIGGITCPYSTRKYIIKQINDLKAKHNISSKNEVKWVKVSESKIDFYKDLIDLFNTYDYLKFRSIVIPDKKKLRHTDYNQDHSTFYYKMYYQMLVKLIKNNNEYSVYIDIRDTHTYEKSRPLLEYLRIKLNDKTGNLIKKIQPINSFEVNIMQLTDILVGMVAYKNRKLSTNNAKIELIQYAESKLGIKFDVTYYGESDKADVFIWQADYGRV